jgi:hypothetical protein
MGYTSILLFRGLTHPTAEDRIMTDMEQFCRSADSKRDNFLSRVFGILNEEIVRTWCASPQSPLIDLGRPTIYVPSGKRHTLDFTFRDMKGMTFVAEMKCELAYDGYRYLRLTDTAQLDHHKGDAFLRFLELAVPGHDLVAKVGAIPIAVDGVMLVWGATTRTGVESVTSTRGIADVLSVEMMINDLRRWDDPHWKHRVDQLSGWCSELFDFLWE